MPSTNHSPRALLIRAFDGGSHAPSQPVQQIESGFTEAILGSKQWRINHSQVEHATSHKETTGVNTRERLSRWRRPSSSPRPPVRVMSTHSTRGTLQESAQWPHKPNFDYDRPTSKHARKHVNTRRGDRTQREQDAEIAEADIGASYIDPRIISYLLAWSFPWSPTSTKMLRWLDLTPFSIKVRTRASTFFRTIATTTSYGSDSSNAGSTTAP